MWLCTPPSETSPIRCTALPSATAASIASRSTGFSPKEPSSIARLMRVSSW